MSRVLCGPSPGAVFSPHLNIHVSFVRRVALSTREVVIGVVVVGEDDRCEPVSVGGGRACREGAHRVGGCVWCVR